MFNLRRPLAPNTNAAPEDVEAVKNALRKLGLYEAPDWGITPYPDPALFGAIKSFQTSQDLRVDGVMKPQGETEAAMLKAAEGTGQKKGKYIWRTRGDGKVRSAHAERNGKVYAWNKPPEGGHPGEAPNCRCRAEVVEKKDCEIIAEERDAAWRRHDALQDPILNARDKIRAIKKELKELNLKRMDIQIDQEEGLRPSRPSLGKPAKAIGNVGLAWSVARMQEERRHQIEQKIAVTKQKLADAEALKQRLENERKNHELNGHEYARRYDECVGKGG